MNSFDLVKQIANILNDKKANNIEIIKISDITIISDYFIIASANNSTHVKSLVDEVELKMKSFGQLPIRVEGYDSGNWIILDYSDVIVHIFYEDTREHYNLEKLWSDGHKIDIEEIL